MTVIINDNINVGIIDVPAPSGQLLDLVHSHMFEDTNHIPALGTDDYTDWLSEFAEKVGPALGSSDDEAIDLVLKQHSKELYEQTTAIGTDAILTQMRDRAAVRLVRQVLDFEYVDGGAYPEDDNLDPRNDERKHYDATEPMVRYYHPELTDTQVSRVVEFLGYSDVPWAVRDAVKVITDAEAARLTH